ncbi:MAG: cardiolipin synthase [Bacteroidia bacterium]|nr:cardiolipin synthase [Bacteroidia bacterium]
MRKFLLVLAIVLFFVFTGWLLVQTSQLIWETELWLDQAKTILSWAVETIYITTVALAISFVIWENGRPSRSLAWIMVLIFLPIAGIVAYLLVGGNLRKEKIFTLKGAIDLRQINTWIDAFLNDWQGVEKDAIDSLQQKASLAALLARSSKAVLTQENKATVLQDGKETFAAIFEAIRAAEHHIHLEYYIMENGVLVNELADLLVAKARAGVEVRLIYDDVGSWSLSNRLINEWEKAGVEAHPFMPVRFPRLGNRINYRNHRKIVVIDGKIGFVGGLNFADHYLDGLAGVGPWRDTHLRLEGEATKALQIVFLTDWFFVSGKDCAGQAMFPNINLPACLPVQIVASGPDSAYPSILQGYFTSITLAKSYLYITNPYLIPTSSILLALQTAALSGVDVRIIIPEKSDSHIADFSTQSYLEELMEAGVQIYLYHHGFVHAKVLVSDDVLSSIGTANWDQRSFEQNFEVNAFLYDRQVALDLKAAFIRDMAHCRKLDLAVFAQRPGWKKLLSAMARLLSPLL